MPVRCILWSRSVSHAEFWNSAGFATMPVSVPARQVRLGNKKVHLMVKKAEWKNGVGRYLIAIR